MGVIIAFVCAFFQSSKDLVSKKLAFSVGGTLSAFASFVYALPFYLVLLALLAAGGYETFTFSTRFTQYVLMRSITDVAAEWLKMSALQHGDISLLACFFALSPVFLLFTSPLITGDHMSSQGIVGVLVVVLGSLVSVYDPALFKRSKELKETRRGISLALLSAFFMSINTCFDRLAALEASPVLSGFAMTALSALFLAPFLLAMRTPVADLKTHSRPFLMRGALETAFMVTKIWALQYMPAPYVMAIQRVAVVFSVAGGHFLFGEKQFGQRLTGGLVVVVGVAILVLSL